MRRRVGAGLGGGVGVGNGQNIGFIDGAHDPGMVGRWIRNDAAPDRLPGGVIGALTTGR